MMPLFKLLSHLPLSLLHRLGSLVGWLVYLGSPAYRRRMRANLRQAGFASSRTLRAAIAAAGQGMLELPFVWLRPPGEPTRRVQVENWSVVERALGQQRGVLFLMPHLGCFELMGQVVAQRCPLTAMYRPHRKAALAPLVEAGRTRHGIALASADLRGVRTLAKALKRGEATVILPDQVPSAGEGLWAPFFNKPAYTMTLPARLALSQKPAIVLTYCERLPLSEDHSHRLWFLPLTDPLPKELPEAVAAINQHMETLIRRCPSQYLWAYNRYKTPAAALLPPADEPAETAGQA
ncbi:MAG: lysophospholipid acyltransferase family protein [Burkholderiaceae bacterium]|nr:MAG: lysophospholipid acyltransferase family protein [Burkholderiaceae bacterium]